MNTNIYTSPFAEMKSLTLEERDIKDLDHAKENMPDMHLVIVKTTAGKAHAKKLFPNATVFINYTA